MPSDRVQKSIRAVFGALFLALLRHVVDARRKGLADMLTRWQPDQHPDVLALIERFSQTLTRDLPAPRSV
jgi:hypothetical protein